MSTSSIHPGRRSVPASGANASDGMADWLSSADLGRRQLAVTGACNVRDLGGYATAQGVPTRWRRFLRADSLHALDADGVRCLQEAGVQTVIDLREPDEAAKAPGPWVQTPAVAYHNLPLFSGLIPRAAMPGDLLRELYVRALDERGDAFAHVFDALSQAGEGAVLFHCSAGKDRTGLVAALLLGTAGVARHDIVGDYALTAHLLQSRMDDLVEICIRQGIAPDVIGPLLACEPATMAAALDHLDTAFGGAQGYLRHIGVSASAIEQLRARLLS